MLEMAQRARDKIFLSGIHEELNMKWKLLSWNVNGIRAAEKKGFLDWLGATGADLVAVQETKAQPDQVSSALMDPPGYQSAWSSAEKKGYSGTCTYFHNPPGKTIEGLGEARFDTEGRTLIHEFDDFVFFNIYFPNGGRGPEWVQHKLAFYKRFLVIAKAYMKKGRSVVATGDFNTAYAEIDLARPKENVNHSGFMPEERVGLGEFFEIGLIDTFRHLHPDTVKYSWWDQVSRARERGVGWRLDYFMVSPDLKDKISTADIHEDVMGSDHCPISLSLDL
jgi:exodeoxyribonuclease III